jgi:exodeoxyribonuclease VIII
MTRLSFTALKEFAKSPNHFLAYKAKKTTDSPAMRRGRLIHKLVLEADEFNKEFAIAPTCDRRTKVGKELWHDFEFFCTNNNITPVTQQEYNEADAVARAIEKNPVSRNLLRSCRNFEQHVEGEIYGVEFHGYVDAMGDMLVDLKTTQNAEPDAFNRTVMNNKYYLQAAIYSHLTGIERFMFIAAETASPNNVAVYELSSDWLAIGEHQLETYIEQFKRWVEEGKPARSYVNEVKTLTPPSWML